MNQFIRDLQIKDCVCQCGAKYQTKQPDKYKACWECWHPEMIKKVNKEYKTASNSEAK